MIPGSTLPINHLHYYFVALLVGALVHELGMSYVLACITSVSVMPVSSLVTFILVHLYPLRNLLNVGQTLQVACAGIWHNVVLFGICKALSKVVSRWIWCHLGWQMLSDGVSVENIHASSPLAPHLKPDACIFQLNDTPLLHGADDWRAFWNQDFATAPAQGFCALIDATTTTSNDASCCVFAGDLPFGNSTNDTISCFHNIALGDVSVVQGEYLNTLQTLASDATMRCSLDANCLGNRTCVIPVTPSMYGQRVRIYADHHQGQELITSIYKGSLRDVLDSGKMLQPLFGFSSEQFAPPPQIPKQLPHQFNLLTSYIATFSLALALLNSVPALNLDGASIMRKLLFKTQKKLFTVITKTVYGMVLFVVIGSVFILLLQNFLK